MEPMKQKGMSLTLVFCFCVIILPIVSQVIVSFDSSLSDEFAGPFPQWLNIKTNFSAVGDGVADDTAAFLAAFSPLNMEAVTIFVPSGRYRITSSIKLIGGDHVSFIGEDPLTTTLFWDGITCQDANNYTCSLFHTDGSASLVLKRITWDGANKLATLVVNTWDGTTNQGRGYSGNGRHEDCIYQNAGVGIFTGSESGAIGPNIATAEWTYFRLRFYNLGSGWRIGDWNALDHNMRFCVFENCTIGVDLLQGNFHVTGSVFLNNNDKDLRTVNGGYFSIRQCFSYSDKQTQFYEMGNNGQTTVQKNVVVRAENVTRPAINLVFGMGPFPLLDNVFVTGANMSYVVVWGDSSYYDMTSINNTWTSSINQTIMFRGYVNRTFVQIQDQWVSYDSVQWSVPILPGFQPLSTEPIFSVPAGANQTVLVDLIKQACDYSTAEDTLRRPIVHMPGLYHLNETLVIPPYCAAQFMATPSLPQVAGLAFLLREAQVPMMVLQTPARATFYDLTMDGGYWSNNDGIWIENIDQMGSRVFFDNIRWEETCGEVLVEGVDFAKIDLDMCVGGGPHPQCTLCPTLQNVSAWAWPGGYGVTGGPCRQTNNPIAKGRLISFGGATGTTSGSNLVDIYNGGQVMIKDSWYEGYASTLVNFTSNHSGTFTYHSSNLSPYVVTAGPIFTFNNFPGNFYSTMQPIIMGLVQDDFCVDPSPSGQIDVINTIVTSPNLTALPRNGCYFLEGYLNDGAPKPVYTSIGEYEPQTYLDSYSFIRDEFNLLQPVGAFNPNKDGLTDVRFHRPYIWHVVHPLRMIGDPSRTTCDLSPATTLEIFYSHALATLLSTINSFFQ